MNYPKYVEVNGNKYEINTDFRVAIRCNEIAENSNIGNYERALGILCTLFGEKAIKNHNDQQELLELAKKYLSCGKELKSNNTTPDMDYVEDMDYIEASFMSDYRIDLSSVDMHWWKFNKLINGLSNSEMGNCCILNRVRNLRNFDLKEVKDPKERAKIQKAKEQVALKRYQHKKVATDEQLANATKFYQELGLIDRE